MKNKQLTIGDTKKSLNRPAWSSVPERGGLRAFEHVDVRYHSEGKLVVGVKRVRKLYGMGRRK